jgi:RND family efflux transporter MFP subunit
MSHRAVWVIVGGVVLLIGVGGGIALDRVLLKREPAAKKEGAQGAGTAAGDDEEPEGAAIVHTVVAKKGELSRSIEGFGTAINPSTSTVAESWPTELLISRLLVQSGQPIAKGEAIAEAAPTRDAETQLAAAQLAVDTSQKALELAQQRLDRGLATRADVQTAQAAVDEARQRGERLRINLPPKDGLLRAHTSGTVAGIRAQAGATLAAGSPILEITSGSVVAQIGIDPADTSSIALGQTFDVAPIDDKVHSEWHGTVSLVNPVINPTTRLAELILSLSGDPLPRAGLSLRARTKPPAVAGVLIPRAALVPQGDGMAVYVVRDGMAERTAVTVALRGREQVVVGSGCEAGDHVIVSGQSQVAPGATVREIRDKPVPSTRAASPKHPDGGTGADH